MQGNGHFLKNLRQLLKDRVFRPMPIIVGYTACSVNGLLVIQQSVCWLCCSFVLDLFRFKMFINILLKRAMFTFSTHFFSSGN